MGRAAARRAGTPLRPLTDLDARRRDRDCLGRVRPRRARRERRPALARPERAAGSGRARPWPTSTATATSRSRWGARTTRSPSTTARARRSGRAPRSRGARFRTLAVADLDGDGTREVVAGSAHLQATEQLVALTAAGAVLPGWPARRSGEPGFGWGLFNENVAIADLDGDGDLELVNPTDTHYVTALDHQGGQLSASAHVRRGKGLEPGGGARDQAADLRGYAQCGVEHRPNFADSAPAIGDLDGDGTPEIVIVGNVQSCAGEYQSLYHAPIVLRRRPHALGRAGERRLDGAPHPARRRRAALRGLRGDRDARCRTPCWRTSTATAGGRSCSRPMTAASTPTGSTAPSTAPGRSTSRRAATLRFASEPAVADLDGDGKAEVIVGDVATEGATPSRRAAARPRSPGAFALRPGPAAVLPRRHVERRARRAVGREHRRRPERRDRARDRALGRGRVPGPRHVRRARPVGHGRGEASSGEERHRLRDGGRGKRRLVPAGGSASQPPTRSSPSPSPALRKPPPARARRRARGDWTCTRSISASPNVSRAFDKLWGRHRTPMFSIVALPPKARACRWSNSSLWVDPQTPPPGILHAHLPPSRSHTARLTCAGIWSDCRTPAAPSAASPRAPSASRAARGRGRGPASRIASSDACGFECDSALRAASSFSTTRRETVKWRRLSSRVSGSTGPSVRGSRAAGARDGTRPSLR